MNKLQAQFVVNTKIFYKNYNVWAKTIGEKRPTLTRIASRYPSLSTARTLCYHRWPEFINRNLNGSSFSLNSSFLGVVVENCRSYWYNCWTIAFRQKGSKKEARNAREKEVTCTIGNRAVACRGYFARRARKEKVGSVSQGSIYEKLKIVRALSFPDSCV